MGPHGTPLALHGSANGFPMGSQWGPMGPHWFAGPQWIAHGVAMGCPWPLHGSVWSVGFHGRPMASPWAPSSWHCPRPLGLQCASPAIGRQNRVPPLSNVNESIFDVDVFFHFLNQTIEQSLKLTVSYLTFFPDFFFWLFFWLFFLTPICTWLFSWLFFWLSSLTFFLLNRKRWMRSAERWITVAKSTIFPITAKKPQISHIFNWPQELVFVVLNRFWAYSTGLEPIQTIKKNISFFAICFFLFRKFHCEIFWR